MKHRPRLPLGAAANVLRFCEAQWALRVSWLCFSFVFCYFFGSLCQSMFFGVCFFNRPHQISTIPIKRDDFLRCLKILFTFSRLLLCENKGLQWHLPGLSMCSATSFGMAQVFLGRELLVMFRCSALPKDLFVCLFIYHVCLFIYIYSFFFGWLKSKFKPCGVGLFLLSLLLFGALHFL